MTNKKFSDEFSKTVKTPRPSARSITEQKEVEKLASYARNVHEEINVHPSMESEIKKRETEDWDRPWSEEGILDAPRCPDGYVQRWIRAESLGARDSINMSRKMRNGWTPVLASQSDDYPSMKTKYGDVIGVEGLVLCRLSVERARKREKFYNQKKDEVLQKMNNDLNIEAGERQGMLGTSGNIKIEQESKTFGWSG